MRVVKRIGRYEITGELGRGGMGTVYEGHDPELERKVAIKVLSGHFASVFRDEARALAALNHPGIVTVHEIGEHEGAPYLVMERLQGRTLRELLHDDPPSRGRAVEICASVAAAIAEAHSRGVLHRDIKPENVVVLENGAVKVIDFGIARRLDASAAPQAPAAEPHAERAARIVSAFARTLPIDRRSQPTERGEVGDTEVTIRSIAASTETVFGTPAYMAPEVLGGGAGSPDSDIYSLGVVVYECLAGHRPFDAPDLGRVLELVLEGHRPPALEDPLAPLVERMLDPDPAQRPSASEAAAQLAGQAPVRSSPRSRRRAFAIATIAVAAVGGGTAAYVKNGPRAQAPTHRDSEPIAIEPFEVAYETYGDAPSGIASVLAVVLAHVDGIRVVEPAQLLAEQRNDGDRAATARRLGARYLVRGKLVETAGQATGDLELVDLVTNQSTHLARREPIAANAALVAELADDIAGRVLPGAHLGSQHAVLSRKLYDLGAGELSEQHWVGARQYLEQAVQADPSSSRAWSKLAEARAWTLAPQPLIDQATVRALDGVPAGPQRTLLEGAGAYLREDFDAAVSILEPLATTAGLSGDDLLDAELYIGESLYHRGDFRRGAEQLAKVFAARPTFQPAGLHVMQNAIVRRDLTRAGVLIGQLHRSQSTYLFAAGDYEQVVASGEFPNDAQARLVLGRALTPDDEAKLGGGLDGAAFHIARALADGDQATARAAFATAWKLVADRPRTDGRLYALGNLIDVMASAGLRDETATLLAFLHDGTSPRYAASYQRLALLSAPLLGTALPEGEGRTPRARKLRAAIAAELAGRRREAATLLEDLVADPGDTYDFPERVALVRNLRAAGDAAQLAAQCKDITHPPVFRWAFLQARAACADGVTRRR